MNRLNIYRVLSFVLLPIGALLALMTLMALIVSLANVAMLFSAFITGSCVIYIYASFSFLQKGILRNLALKPSLKDWIKVNGYVAVFFSVMGLMQGIVLLANPATLKAAMDTFTATQTAALGDIDKTMMMKVMRGMLYFIVALSAVLLLHISNTFRLLRQYKRLFES